MRKTTLPFIVQVLLMLSGIGQSEIRHDTIRFSGLSLIKPTTFGCFQSTTIDSFLNPSSYLISNDKGYFIAIEKERDSTYFIFDLNCNGIVEETGRYNFDQMGNEELIITWKKLSGHSGRAGGLSEVERTIQIIDLDYFQTIFEKDFFYSNYSWGVEEIEDEELSFSEVSYCYNYELKFQKKEIKLELKENSECQQVEIEDIDTSLWIYRLKNKMWTGEGYKK